jgi:hypothetical protein
MAKEKINHHMWSIAIVACVAIVALVFMVSINLNLNMIGWAKGGGSTKQCTDSDGGLNYYVIGHVSGSMPKRFGPYDSCLSSATLRETYCSSNNMGTAVQYTCPYGCANGVCNSAPSQNYCGNGVIDIGEDCDGTNLGGKTCLDVGFTAGTLKCTSACKFDTASCSYCNNNAICEPLLKETAQNCLGDCTVTPSNTAVFVSPGKVSFNTGGIVTLDLGAANIPNLFGFQFDISYNPNLLEFYGLQEGTFLSNNGQYTTYCINYTYTPGLIKNIACTKLGGTGLTGSGTLERISFRTLAAGTSNIILSNVKLSDPNSARIGATILNGQVIIS